MMFVVFALLNLPVNSISSTRLKLERVDRIIDMTTLFTVRYLAISYVVLSAILCILNILYCYFVIGWMDPDYFLQPYNFS